MNIEIISATENPMDVISMVAGNSYGKSDIKHNRVVSCFNKGHDSIFEHATVTFRVDGISRACSHQLVRHRMASYCQVSQRYTKVDIYSDDWYVIPKFIEADGQLLESFKQEMFSIATEYEFLLMRGIKPEDARYILPEATKTCVVVTMNVRELYHFLDLRMDSHAQWEIRDMANKVLETVENISEQWNGLMYLWRNKHSERTCKIEQTTFDEFGIYDNLTCGHNVSRQGLEPTKFCPKCGAKVVE